MEQIKSAIGITPSNSAQSGVSKEAEDIFNQNKGKDTELLNKDEYNNVKAQQLQQLPDFDNLKSKDNSIDLDEFLKAYKEGYPQGRSTGGRRRKRSTRNKRKTNKKRRTVKRRKSAKKSRRRAKNTRRRK